MTNQIQQLLRVTTLELLRSISSEAEAVRIQWTMKAKEPESYDP